MEADMQKKTQKAIIVGGSIAGLSCAHSSTAIGWEVIVIEKSITPPSVNRTGAGLGLERQAMSVINRWLGNDLILHDISFPLTAELHQVVDGQKKRSRTLIRDDSFTYRCVHWTDLHSVLHKALPHPVTMLRGHCFQRICCLDDKGPVKILVQVLQTNEMKEMAADLLVAADGSLSMIRHHFLPDHKLRYSGYSAWRGVFDYSEDEKSDTILSLKQAYPELGSCLYFDYVSGNHCVLFELRNKRLNWIWYFNSPEPDKEGNSATKKVNDEMIGNMHEEAKRLWKPELALLMKNTKQPFINIIYDSDPLQKLFHDNVVFVGDAAHPTTPHASRSTNMSILDAEVLGLCLRKWGLESTSKALEEFQNIRKPVVSEQVMYSRYMGRLKQGLLVDDGNNIFDVGDIQLKSTPFYEYVPVSA